MRELMERPTEVLLKLSLICSNMLAREGLKRILMDEGIKVDACENVQDLVENAQAPDLVVVDIDDSDHDCQRISELVGAIPGCKVVVLAAKFDLDFMVSAFHCGVDGFILKEIGCHSLVGSLHLVAMGEKVLPSQLVDYLPRFVGNTALAPVTRSVLAESLSEREKETLRCLVQGCANKVIARRMEISEATVKVHVKATLRKLSVKNRTQAAIWAVNNGIVPSHMAQADTEQPAIPLTAEVEPQVALA